MLLIVFTVLHISHVYVYVYFYMGPEYFHHHRQTLLVGVFTLSHVLNLLMH